MCSRKSCNRTVCVVALPNGRINHLCSTHASRGWCWTRSARLFNPFFKIHATLARFGQSAGGWFAGLGTSSERRVACSHFDSGICVRRCRVGANVLDCCRWWNCVLSVGSVSRFPESRTLSCERAIEKSAEGYDRSRSARPGLGVLGRQYDAVRLRLAWISRRRSLEAVGAVAGRASFFGALQAASASKGRLSPSSGDAAVKSVEGCSEKPESHLIVPPWDSDCGL